MTSFLTFTSTSYKLHVFFGLVTFISFLFMIYYIFKIYCRFCVLFVSTGREVVFFMLNSTEHEISNAHKNLK